MDEVRLQVRDALEEGRLVSQGNMVEKNQMLMNLSHLAHVRNDSQAELLRQQAHRKKF